MKTIILGIFFVLIGILLFIFNQYDFVTSDKVIHVSDLKIARGNIYPLEWSPWLGVAVLLIGLLTIAIGILNKK